MASTQSEIMRELEEFSPSDLRRKLEHEVSSMQNVPAADPIMADLLKIQGRSLPIIGHENKDKKRQYPIEKLSLRLKKLLELITDPSQPDDSRIYQEQLLKDLISHEPRTKKGSKQYPKDYLSQILIDNYALFLKVSTSYFNLSFSSLITRYLVSVIYNLECWEIYHLLHLVPNLEYMLKLLEFDIKSTSFGYIVKPPENFLDYNLRQGLQYPFPFPFYNFSYHTVNPRAASKKFAAVSIQPYIDLRLDKSEKPIAKPAKKSPKYTHEHASIEAEFSGMSDSDQSVGDVEGEAGAEDFQRWKIVYMFVEMTPERIRHDFDLSFQTPGQQAYEEEEYDSEDALAMEAKEKEAVDYTTPGLKIVSSVFQKEFTKAYDTGLVKHTFLHQCKLMDPASHKTCLKVFYGKNELQRHQEFVHATEKRLYRCVYCLKADSDESKKCYPRYDSLARHIRRKHGIVGKENKRAIVLARKAAESEQSSGKSPSLTFKELVQSLPDPHAEPVNGSELRATLESNTGKSRVPGTMPPAEYTQYEVKPETGSAAGNNMPFIVVDKTTAKRRVTKPQSQSQKSRKPSSASVPVPVSAYDMPYNEFRPSEAGGWSAAETANVFEYQAQQQQQQQQQQSQHEPKTTAAAAQNSPYHPYSSAYAPAYGTPMYATPDGALVYGHPVNMGMAGQNNQYPYMGAIYAQPYGQPPVMRGAEHNNGSMSSRSSMQRDSNPSQNPSRNPSQSQY